MRISCNAEKDNATKNTAVHETMITSVLPLPKPNISGKDVAKLKKGGVEDL